MRVTVSSEFPVPATDVWDKLQWSDTLVFVADEVVVYDAADQFPSLWSVGTKVNLRPRLFGFLPPGDHVVEFVKIDQATMTIVTNESGGSIKRWDHTMHVEPLSDERCRYTDSIVIEAGLLTPVIYGFAQFFYRHRHRRWRELLEFSINPL